MEPLNLGPVCEIRNDKEAFPWRVVELNSKTAGQGVIRSYNCLFTMEKYWPYGYFSSRSACELPGKLFRVRASGREGDSHHYMSPAVNEKVNQYKMVDGRLYAAWRLKLPAAGVKGGQFSCVRPSQGPWEVWCNRNSNGKITWTVKINIAGRWAEKNIKIDSAGEDWADVQLILDPQEITLQINRSEVGRFSHEAYREPFSLQFGSRQPLSGGQDVISEYREVFVDRVPYPSNEMSFAEGPEDLRPEDHAIVGFLRQAAPNEPRISEGDILELHDGSLLAVYTIYHAGKGWDGSPARIDATTSRDGGKTWSRPWTAADVDEGSDGNVMSASLLLGQNGDILLVYFDKTPRMKAKGMVLRRSADGGKTWSPRIPVTPPDSPGHNVANNACMVRLTTGRIVLATREHLNGIRQSFACYSDDDGRTWKKGNYVPEADITPEERLGQNLNEPCICELADGRLLMTMRTIAGGQFFSWSRDGGESWSKPILSPLSGCCGPALIRRIPNSPDILAFWAYGFGNRTPLVSAVSSDGGLTWKHIKLLEKSLYHAYGYVSCTFVRDRVILSYMHHPIFSSIFRFEVEPGYIDQRYVNLPLTWFYREIP